MSPPGGETAPTIVTEPSRPPAVVTLPAISLGASYSDRADEFGDWWLRETGVVWGTLRREALSLLDEASRLEQTARLVGTLNLSARQQFLLALAELFQNAFLRQSAGGDDEWCPPARQAQMLQRLVTLMRQPDGGALPSAAEIRAS